MVGEEILCQCMPSVVRTIVPPRPTTQHASADGAAPAVRSASTPLCSRSHGLPGMKREIEPCAPIIHTTEWSGGETATADAAVAPAVELDSIAEPRPPAPRTERENADALAVGLDSIAEFPSSAPPSVADFARLARLAVAVLEAGIDGPDADINTLPEPPLAAAAPAAATDAGAPGAPVEPARTAGAVAAGAPVASRRVSSAVMEGGGAAFAAPPPSMTGCSAKSSRWARAFRSGPAAISSRMPWGFARAALLRRACKAPAASASSGDAASCGDALNSRSGAGSCRSAGAFTAICGAVLAAPDLDAAVEPASFFSSVWTEADCRAISV